MKPYQEYTIEDFLLDESFVAWVNQSDSDAKIGFWDSFLTEFPDQRTSMMEARRIVSTLPFNTAGRPPEVVAQIKRNIDAHADYHSEIYISKKVTFWRWSMAAVVTLLLASTIIYFLRVSDDQYQIATTDYGETEEVHLPDGTQVVLNANSKLRYALTEESSSPREVWLEGEAFFSVTHTVNNRKFMVHTSNLTVEVLGTEFNVNDRRGKTSVVLNSGRVKLAIPSQVDTSSVMMQPGERVQYTEEQITQEVVNTEVYTVWQNRQLMFDRTTLQEIAEILEDQYGYEVIITGQDLSQREISATEAIDIDDLDVLLEVIAKMYQINLTKDGNTLRVNDS
ncbi:MAG: FecR domain-containing protein [Bacteroidota bacterium]